MKTMATMTDFQTAGKQLAERTQKEGVVPVTNRGRVELFLVSREKFAALLETMELQKVPELMKLIAADKAGRIKVNPLPDEL
jgi:PHD/YefM family antitoxin component YafN of YafNO toxin-antitoxin module